MESNSISDRTAVPIKKVKWADQCQLSIGIEGAPLHWMVRNAQPKQMPQTSTSLSLSLSKHYMAGAVKRTRSYKSSLTTIVLLTRRQKIEQMEHVSDKSIKLMVYKPGGWKP